LEKWAADAATVPWITKAQNEIRRPAMEVTLPADLRKQVEQELASGRYQSPDELIEQAVRHFLDERQRDQRRLDALRRIGQAGLSDRVLIPDQK
jgi:putative addiction module CopG family antidote